MYHGIPIIGLPLGADQKKNAAIAQNNGIGIALSWKGLTEEILTSAINEIVTNQK